jgi:hypothetical protein
MKQAKCGPRVSQENFFASRGQDSVLPRRRLLALFRSPALVSSHCAGADLKRKTRFSKSRNQVGCLRFLKQSVGVTYVSLLQREAEAELTGRSPQDENLPVRS